jgi:hypothetical protein
MNAFFFLTSQEILPVAAQAAFNCVSIKSASFLPPTSNYTLNQKLPCSASKLIPATQEV